MTKRSTPEPKDKHLSSAGARFVPPSTGGRARSPGTSVHPLAPGAYASRGSRDTRDPPAPSTPRPNPPASTPTLQRAGHHPAPDATRDEVVTAHGVAAAETKGLSLPERDELRRQGAKAAARGEEAAANPMDRSTNSPGKTGEPPVLWAKRRQAWQDGHEAQSDVPRGAQTRGGERDDER